MSDVSRSKPRIVFLSAFFTPFISGGERFAVEIIKRLADAYELILVTGRHEKRMLPQDLDGSVCIHRVGYGGSMDKYLYAPLAAWKTWRLKPDLVHAGMESFAGIGLWMFHRFFDSKTPCLLTLQNGSMDAPRFQKKFPFWLFKAIHLAPMKVQAISHALADRARRLGSKDVVVIPNGIDVAVFLEARKVVQKKQCIVGVGRLHIDKGWDIAIRAFATIADRVPNITFQIAGEGNQESSLKQLINTLGLKERVQLIGNLPYADVPRFIASGLVFVGASRAEGLGNVFVEAQAAGTPPVATRVGGIPDVICDGETGLLVPAENPEAMGEAIAILLNDASKREVFRINGLKGLDRYDWEKIAHEIGLIYQSLLMISAK